MKQKFFTAIIFLLSSLVAFASGISLKYEILTDSTVEVTKDTSYKTLKSVVIPEKVELEGKSYKVTSIGMDAFANCSSLESVKIPESVTNIGIDAFCYCSR